MQFLMLTYSSEDGAAHYDAETPEEQAASRQRHVDWFADHAEHIRGGHELTWPPVGGVIREYRTPKPLDGPFVESKEMLGGVIILETDTVERALDLAATWPSLEIYPGTRVDVLATGSG